MEVILSKQQAIAELTFLKKTWKEPPFQFPYFSFEIDYLEFFIYLLKYLPDERNLSFIPAVSTILEKGFETAFKKICYILDQKETDGITIYELMSDQQLILKGDKIRYNRKVPGKSPKGLTTDPWKDYNHWILAKVLWMGFVEAHEPEFKIILPERDEIEAPIEVLFRSEYKPLWGMWTALERFGRPYLGISTHPLGAVILYINQCKNGQL